jgi:NADH:ubiquinone oxidoreductase subunit 2 (subunit N)
MLIAYSTVAQLGYLMLVFPLTARDTGAMAAWGGALYFMLAHACAKASVFSPRVLRCVHLAATASNIFAARPHSFRWQPLHLPLQPSV